MFLVLCRHENLRALQSDTVPETPTIGGKESLWEVASGRGCKPTYGPEKIQAIVKATLQTKPKGMTQ